MKINLKGLTKESIAGVLILLVALINAILQIFGIDILPISNDDINNIVSTVFLLGSSIYTVYKNFNISTPSQTGQHVTDAIKNGEVLIDQVEDMIDKLKKENTVES